MTAHFYVLYLSVCDATKSSAIIEVKMQYISISQIYYMIEALEIMLDRFKHSAVSYCSIINDTVNTINSIMAEVEHNTVFCALCPYLQQHDADSITDEFIGSLDENTLKATIDIEVPSHAIDSTSLQPFLYRVHGRNIFSFEIQSAVTPNWNHVLQDLEIQTV